MTVDRHWLQPTIGGVTLFRATLCSRRRVALSLVASALTAALLLYADQLASVHAVGPRSMLPRRPPLAAGLSLDLAGDRAVNALVAAPAVGGADDKLRVMATAGQSAVAIALLASSSASDGRATVSAATVGHDVTQRSSSVDVTTGSWNTARLMGFEATSLSTAAAAATYDAPKPSTATLRISAASSANFEKNASAVPDAELTSLDAHVATYAATSTRDQYAAAAAASIAVTAATYQTATPLDGTSPLITARPTVYVRFIDPLAGLGNKMFQYASGFGLALRHGAEARLVVDHAEIRSKLAGMRRVFRMSPLPEQPAAPSPAEAATLLESGWGRYDAARFDNRSSFAHGAHLMGYFQSWRYFEPVASHIRSEFALTPYAASLADNFLRRSDSGGRTAEGNGSSNLFVGVHVRRGDMVNRPTLYAVAPPDFLFNAMNHYIVKYGFANQLTFVMATNDPDWVKSFVETRLPKHIRVLQLQFTPEEDMAVLSRCNHSIATAGTFGWWSAWLAGGDVVYYKDFMRPESLLYSGHIPSDYYPPHWLGMS